MKAEDGLIVVGAALAELISQHTKVVSGDLPREAARQHLVAAAHQLLLAVEPVPGDNTPDSSGKPRAQFNRSNLARRVLADLADVARCQALCQPDKCPLAEEMTILANLAAAVVSWTWKPQS